MSRTQQFIKSTLATGIYQVVLMLSGFILPKVMLSCYGSEVNGLVTSITQFIQYITLVEAGLSGAAIYALYKPLAENNHRQISRVVVAARKFYTKSGWIFVVLVAMLAALTFSPSGDEFSRMRMMPVLLPRVFLWCVRTR